MSASARTLFPVLLLAAASAFAQPGTPPGPGPGPGAGPGAGNCGPGASAADCPRSGGPGAGPGAGRHGRYGPSYAPGWSLMNSRERSEYRRQMLAATTVGECRKVVAEHRAQMAERAKARGVGPVPGPRRNPCAGLPE